MKNHTILIILPSKFACGIILRWLNSHYTPCPATERRVDDFNGLFVAGKAMGITMNYGEIKFNDIANGEGVRTSLFVSGCRHHCKNCFNEQTWDFSFGQPFTEETMEEILDSCNHDWINGLSLLGGEPFEPENQRVLLPFLVMFRERFPDKTIWCYTGFTLEEIMGKRANSRAFTEISSEMLSLIDVLVDGPFVEAKKDISLIFRGSSNQRIIDIKKTFENKQVELYLDDGK